MRSLSSMPTSCPTVLGLLLVVLSFRGDGPWTVRGQTVQTIPDNAPDSYKDNVYHCLNPDSTDNPIPCDPTTFRWDTEALTPDPPLVCIEEWDGQDDLLAVTSDIIDGESVDVSDRLEPCVLWAMEYVFETSATEAPSENSTILDEIDIPDDIYHCRDPNSTFHTKVSISCDPWTHLWVLDELDPEQPPTICGSPENFVIAMEDMSNVQDWFEPCVHWAMLFGNLVPSVAPTKEPTTVDLSNTVALQPVVLTFTWAEDVLSAPFAIDRVELQALTQRHLLEALQAQLGATLISSLDILMSTSDSNDDQTWTEILTGTVTLKEDSGIPSATVQRLVLESMEGEGLELYQFRLKISSDFTLRLLESVQVDSLSGDDSLQDKDTKVDGGDDKHGMGDKLFIIVVASCSAALAAMCLFGYCLFLYTARRVEMVQAKALAINARPQSDYKSSVASSSKHSKVSIHNLPFVNDTAKALGEAPHHQDEDGSDDENPMSLISMSAFGDDENPKYQHPSQLGRRLYPDDTDDEEAAVVRSPKMGAHFDADEDNHSVGTSVYSYFNQAEDQSMTTNDDTFLASIIGKRGGLYDDESTLGPASSPVINRKKTFSVLDTLTKFTSPPTKDSSAKRPSSLEKLVNQDTATTNNNIINKNLNNNVAKNNIKKMDVTTTDGVSDHGKYRYDDYVLEEGAQDPVMVDHDDTEDEKTSHANQTTNSTFSASLDEVEDYASEMGTTVTSSQDYQTIPPVKERMETLWAQEDGYHSHAQQQQPQQKGKDDEEKKETEPKASKQRIKVFQDDGSGAHSGSAAANGGPDISMESDESPAASILDQQPPAPLSTPMKMVNVMVSDDRHDETVDGDDDNEMAFQLPNQLTVKAADALRDDLSHSSTLSSRSGRSNRSVRSVRTNRQNSFGAASLRADADAVFHKQEQQRRDLEEESVKSSDSAMYRSLLGQDDTNDAGLFGKTTTTNPDADGSHRSPQTAPSNPLLSNLIQSFDEVWSKDEDNGVEKPFVMKDDECNDVDSDEDDVYLESNEDDDADDGRQSDNDSVKSGASRAVQQLSSMLSIPFMNVFPKSTIIKSNDDKIESSANEPSPTKVMDVPNEVYDLETKRSFEIQDSSDDESEPGRTVDNAQEAHRVALNMERLRRMSLTGYAETMASI